MGASKIDSLGLVKNYYILGGLVSFTAVLVLFIIAFRMGGRMFVVYPVYATTYIWGGLLAYYLIKEPIGIWQLVGTALIMLGVSAISLGHPQ